MQTVAVFFGGRSNEREISVITGLYAVNLLRTGDLRVVPVYLPPEGGMVTGKFLSPAQFRKGALPPAKPVFFGEGCLLYGKRRKKITVFAALNCCHGGMGEDGTLSALLRWYRIASASPDVPMSAVFMDKTLSKIALRGLRIPTARGFFLYETTWKERAQEQAEALGYPLVVKPARLGSSIGIKVVKDREGLFEALAGAFRFDDRVLVEEYFEGKRDINCAARNAGGRTELSPLEEVFSEGEILSFSEKYEGRAAKHRIPADLPEAVACRIREYTALIYETFGGRGVVRADFLVVGEDVYFNELNTVPGSLACYLFGDTLTKNREFLLSLIREARAAEDKEKEVLVSGILEGKVFSGKKGR